MGRSPAPLIFTIMTYKKFIEQATFDYIISCDRDRKDEIINIRFVNEFGGNAEDVLRDNGYKCSWVGCKAVEFIKKHPITVTFFKENIDGDLVKNVVDTGKETFAEAFDVALANGAEYNKQIKFEIK